MDRLSPSERRGIALFFAAAFLAFFAWAFPDMTRIFTIPGAIICLAFSIYFLWPEIKSLIGFLSPLKLRTTIVALMLGLSALVGDYWYYSKFLMPSLPDVVLVEKPSLLSLFMSAFGDANFKIMGMQDINEKGLDGRIYYRVLAEFNSNTKFIAFYIPKLSETPKWIYYMRDNALYTVSTINSAMNVVTKNELNTSSVSFRDFMFSNTVHIFYEDDVLDLKQLSDLVNFYKEKNEIVQFHSTEYKLRVWDLIKAGKLPKVPAYELRNGLIQLVRQH